MFTITSRALERALISIPCFRPFIVFFICARVHKKHAEIEGRGKKSPTKQETASGEEATVRRSRHLAGQSPEFEPPAVVLYEYDTRPIEDIS